MVELISAGDILFYKAGNGNWQDEAIRLWTASPFVHVAIAVSPVQKIEALANGVLRTPLAPSRVTAMWKFHGDHLSDGLAWLTGEVGQSYGYADILDAILARFEQSVSIVSDHFDCSALATEFLLKCGGVEALRNITNPHTVTPAGLAQLLGVAS